MVDAGHYARGGADGEANDVTLRRALSRRWAELIYRIYDVDPMGLPSMRARVKILTFIIDPKVIR